MRVLTAITFLLVIFPIFVFGQEEVQCLNLGWPAIFEKNICQLNEQSSSFEKYTQLNEECPESQLACNPAIFGPKVCIAESSSNSNLSCLSKVNKSEVSKISKYISDNEAELEIFDTLYVELQIICDEDFGDPRNTVYCDQFEDWVESVAEEINKAQNITPTSNSLEKLIEFEEKLNEFMEGRPSSPEQEEGELKGEGDTQIEGNDLYSELKIIKMELGQGNMPPEIFDGPRTSSLPIPEDERPFISLSSNITSRPSQTVTFSFPSKQVSLNLYRLNSTETILDFKTKKFYLEFAKEKQLPPNSELNLKGYALASELVERLRSNFDLEHNKDLVKLMNSMESDDWKKFLFGKQGDAKNIFRYSGLLELRRKYHDLDEHFKIMMNEKYSSKDFETEYFIPTGFIEVDNNQYLNIKEIIDGNIEINPKTLKIKIIKEITIFVFNEISQKGDIDKDLKEFLNSNICQQDCAISNSFPFGDMIEVISKIEVSNGDEANNATYLNPV